MAKVKFGAIVVAASGSLGGHTFSKNRGGSVMRTKVTPANGRSVAQSAVRNRFTNFSQGWRGLSQAARDAWNNAVSNYATTDIFGDVRNPSGINLYQKLNNIISIIDGTFLGLPPLPSYVQALTITSLTATSATPTLVLTLGETLASETNAIIFATAPMSAGKNYVKSDYRIIQVIDEMTVTPVNLLAAYVAKFGSVGEIGQKIFVKVVPANNATGQVNSGAVTSVILSA